MRTKYLTDKFSIIIIEAHPRNGAESNLIYFCTTSSSLPEAIVLRENALAFVLPSFFLGTYSFGSATGCRALSEPMDVRLAALTCEVGDTAADPGAALGPRVTPMTRLGLTREASPDAERDKEAPILLSSEP